MAAVSLAFPFSAAAIVSAASALAGLVLGSTLCVGSSSSESRSSFETTVFGHCEYSIPVFRLIIETQVFLKNKNIDAEC